ncbi:MAG: secondary thiamine-phosphate synthase enzyme YjbQ [Actinomycetota bacterium]
MKSKTTESVIVAAKRAGFVDVTEELQRAIKDASVTEGCAVVYCRHTTCGLIINECEDGAFDDLRRHLIRLIPADGYFAHDDLEIRTQNLQPNERANGWSHVTQMILGGTSHAIPVAAGEPLLGEWQRLIFVELDEPKERKLLFHVFGE